MKAPHTPTQFRTAVRHYHRTRPAPSDDWESWIGEDGKPKTRKFGRKLSFSVAVIALLAISVGAIFLFGGL